LGQSEVERRRQVERGGRLDRGTGRRAQRPGDPPQPGRRRRGRRSPRLQALVVRERRARGRCRGRVRDQGQPSRHPGRFWTCWKPNRPLMHKWPWVTEWSDGLVTFTICPCCTCSSRLQPTPQNEQIVVVTLSSSGCQSSASRSSCSFSDFNAP